MKTNRTFVWSVPVLAAASGWTTTTSASVTEVKFNHKEPDQRKILNHLLGGDFIANGLNFANGSITATRLSDQQDQDFTGRTFQAQAVARFSNYTQSFGVWNNSFQKRFDVIGNHYNVTGSATIDMTNLSAFGRSGNSGTDSSISSQNADHRDHLVTYKITGDQPNAEYMLFWEDLNLSPSLRGGRTPRDFNDLVIELTSNQTGNLIPLPPALASGAALGGVILLAGFIKRCRFASPAR